MHSRSMPRRFTQVATAAALTVISASAFAQQATTPARPASAPQAQAQERIVVTGIRASLQASMTAQQNADTNVEVLTAEDVGKMPDKNVADSLSRLPGVNVQFGGALAMDEAERVAIRGTSPNLNLVTVGGHALSSGDWHVGDQGSSGRSVGFGLLPSQIIGRSIVYKTGQANITEGGIAGTVDIELRKPFDFRAPLTGDVSIGFVHATLPKKTDPQVGALVSWKNPANTFGLLLQAYKEDRHLRRDGQETFSFNNVAANSAAALANPALAGKRLPGSLNSALFEGVRKREGVYFASQFKPTNTSELAFSFFRSELAADNYNSSAFALPGTLVNQGANGYLIQNAVIEGDVITSATLVRNPASPATYNVIGMQFDHNVRQGAKSLSQFYDLEGKFQLNSALSFKGRAGETEGSGVTNSQPSLTFGLLNPERFVYQINTSRPTDYRFTNAAGATTALGSTAAWRQMSNTGASVKSIDKENYLHLDGDFKPASGPFPSIKFGVRSAKHIRTYDVIAPRWNAQDLNGAPVSPSPFFSVTGGLLVDQGAAVGRPPIVAPGQTPVPATAYPGNFASGLNAAFPRDLFRFDPSQIQSFANNFVTWNEVYGKTWTSGYRVEEVNQAAYVMADLDFGQLTGNAGVRFVRTELDSLSYQALPATGANSCAVLVPCAVPGAIVGSVFATYLPQRVQTKQDDVLPSINLRYRAAPGHIVRASVSKTLGRANYNELAGAVSLNNTLLTGSSGNPNLKPITATNLDLSYGWYFKPQASFTASIFQQDIKDYVKAGTAQVDFFNTATNQMATYTLSTRVGVSAKIKGTEVALNMPVAAGFGVGVNGTFVDGKDQDGVELLGTSKTTYNLIGWFENDKLSARVAWNERSDYAIGFVGNGTNTPNNGVHRYKGSGTLSASVTYKLTDKIRLTLDGNNLNNPVRSTYFITENAPGYWHQSGRQYFLSLRAKF